MEIIFIVLAVVVVLGLIGAASGVKTPQQEAQEKHDNFVVRKSKWISAVVDRNLEIELEDYVYRGDHNELRKQVLEAYAEMPWKKDINYICYTPEEVAAYFGRGSFTKKERETIAQNNRLEALRILLAKKGKLKSLDAEYGMANNGFGAPTTKMMHEWNTDSADFALWVDKQLRAHGICEPLYIETSPQMAFHLTAANKFRNGSYKWEPALYPTTKIMG